MANVGMPGCNHGRFHADYATNGGSVQITWGYGPASFTAAAVNSGFSDMKLVATGVTSSEAGSRPPTSRTV